MLLSKLCSYQEMFIVCPKKFRSWSSSLLIGGEYVNRDNVVFSLHYTRNQILFTRLVQSFQNL